MAIYPLSFPPVVPSSETLLIQSKQSVQTSAFTGKTQVIQNYAAWSLSFAFPRMSVSRAQVVAAWCDQLQGSYGTFTYQPATSVYPIASALSLASTGYVTTNEVVIGGWVPGAPTGMRVGQHIQIGAQLVRIAAVPLVADNTGAATIEFNPPLRSDVAAQTHVETTNPKGVFRLTSDSSGSGSSGSGFQIDFDFVPEFATMNALEDISQ